jgi:serine/threonine-protein kinase HipA
MPASDLRRATRAVVYKGDAVAGELVRDGDDIRFTYRDDYPVDLGPVARTLPVRTQPYIERGGAVPAFFAGLLPEGRRLSAIRAELKTSADDEFTQLIAVGADCIGDVRVIAPGTTPVEPIDIPERPTEFRALFSAILSERPLADRSIPGVQDKISNSMISVPVTGRFGPAIVKLTPAAHPRIVENEAFFLDLAKECKLPVPRHEVVHDGAGEAALVVERFDRIVTKDHVTRIPQEDAVQLLGRWPSAKYLISTREVFETVAANTTAALPELQKLITLFALSYVIGNGDLHGKNVSVYRTGGLWRLTPVYDLLSTLPYGDQTMALAFEGRDDNIRLRDFIALASRERLPEKATRAAISRVCDVARAAIPRLAQIGLEQRATEDLARVMQKRITDLSDSQG